MVLAGLRVEMAGLRVEMAGLRVEMVDLRVEMGGLRVEMAGLRAAHMIQLLHYFPFLVRRVVLVLDQLSMSNKQVYRILSILL